MRFEWSAASRSYCATLFSALGFDVHRCVVVGGADGSAAVAIRERKADETDAGRRDVAGASCLRAPGPFRMLDAVACAAGDIAQARASKPRLPLRQGASSSLCRSECGVAAVACQQWRYNDDVGTFVFMLSVGTATRPSACATSPKQRVSRRGHAVARQTSALSPKAPRPAQRLSAPGRARRGPVWSWPTRSTHDNVAMTA